MLVKKIFLFSFVMLYLSGMAQEKIDHATRGNFLLDIVKYVTWKNEEFNNSPDFLIGILTKETDFILELQNLVKTRDHVHRKKIKIIHFREVDHIKPTHVLFAYHNNEYKINDLLKIVKGKHTLLVTEGFEFQKSMINFVLKDNKLRFEANEKLMNTEMLHVSNLFLAQAIKTREDWENLYKKTDEALEQEKQVTEKLKQELAKLTELIQAKTIQLEKLNEDIIQKQEELDYNSRLLLMKEHQMQVANDSIESKQVAINQKIRILEEKENQVQQRDEDIKVLDQQISNQKFIMGEQLKALEKQRLFLVFMGIVLVFIIILSLLIYQGYKIKKDANRKLEEKNKKINAQKNQIEKERDIVRSQRDQIAYQKKHITDSIQYAKRIQTALLPSLEFFSDKLDHFVLFKPRDIVSGDFYWHHNLDDKYLVVASDCTGHGVPGAFMSMLGISLLNEIVINEEIIQPDKILNELRKKVILSLQQFDKKSKIKDGMDITICLIDRTNNKLYFSGANNPLFLFRNNELTVIKGDKMPVAIHEIMEPFTLHEIDIDKGDTFYIFSDGFADQFGGPFQKKFLVKNFKKLLADFQYLPMLEQGSKLNEIFEEWKTGIEQIDDVCVIGVRY
ncbi:MAG: YfiR/HmsC family protein [Bacteroidota bacterium]